MYKKEYSRLANSAYAEARRESGLDVDRRNPAGPCDRVRSLPILFGRRGLVVRAQISDGRDGVLAGDRGRTLPLNLDGVRVLLASHVGPPDRDE